MPLILALYSAFRDVLICKRVYDLLVGDISGNHPREHTLETLQSRGASCFFWRALRLYHYDRLTDLGAFHRSHLLLRALPVPPYVLTDDED